MKIACRRATRLTLWASLSFLYLAAPHPLDAQDGGSRTATITGIVEDIAARRGIAAASIRLAREDPGNAPSQLSAVTTDDRGRFVVSELETGSYQMMVQAFGYVDLQERILVTGTTHLDIGLVPHAIELDPVVVVTRRSRHLENVGFYQRRDFGRARSTFTRDEIRAYPGNRISDVLRTVPGVSVRQPDSLSNPDVVFRAGCLPDVVLDGINLGTDVRVDDVARSRDVEGLEVHRGSTGFFPFSNSACGSIVVWTIDPTVDEGRRPWSWRRFAVAAGIVGMVLFIAR